MLPEALAVPMACADIPCREQRCHPIADEAGSRSLSTMCLKLSQPKSLDDRTLRILIPRRLEEW